MPESQSPVVPKSPPKTEADFHDLVVAGLARVAVKIGRGTLADKMGRTTRALDKVFGGSTPEAKALWDATTADPTVLDEIAAAYGFVLIPMQDESAGDLTTAAGLCHAAAELIQSYEDGVRDHRETMKVADMLRPHIGPVLAIVRAADKLRAKA